MLKIDSIIYNINTLLKLKKEKITFEIFIITKEIVIYLIKEVVILYYLKDYTQVLSMKNTYFIQNISIF